jgi:hypothetical protein
MQIACFVIGVILVAIAISSASRVYQERRWQPTKAAIVRCRRVDPFGQPPSAARRRQVVVILDDGTEEVHSRIGGPESLYLAELVYLVDGAPYSAYVPLDQPEDGTLTLWLNPDNPREYAAELPGYWFAGITAVFGVIFIAVALV